MKRCCAALLTLSLVMAPLGGAVQESSAATKKAKITVKTKVSVVVGKKKNIKLSTKNVAEIKSIKAISLKKKNIKVLKVKKTKTSARIKIKALKAKSSKLKITVQYIENGGSDIKKKNLVVKVTGKNPSSEQVPTENEVPSITKSPIVTTAPTNPPVDSPTSNTPVGPENTDIAQTTNPTETNPTETNPTETQPSEGTTTPVNTPQNTDAAQTPAPTLMQTPEPTPETSKITALEPVYFMDGYYSSLSICFNSVLSLSDDDFVVSYKAYGEEEVQNCELDSVETYNGFTYYLIFTDAGALALGNEITVSVPSLTDETKKMTCTLKSSVDNTTQSATILSGVDGVSKEVSLSEYYLIGDVSVSKGEETWPSWFSAEVQNVEDNPVLAVNISEVAAGVYTIPVIITDAIGTTFTINLEILIADEQKIILKDTQVEKTIRSEDASSVNLDITYVNGGPVDEEGTAQYTLSAERTEGDSSKILTWSVSEEGLLTVSGNVDADQTFSVKVMSESDNSIYATVIVTLDVVDKVLVSGKVVDVNGEALYYSDIYYTDAADEMNADHTYSTDGEYSFEMYPGTYNLEAFVQVCGKPYYCKLEPLVIENDSEDLDGFDFQFEFEQCMVSFELSEDSTFQIPEGYESIYYNEWYDEKGNYIDYGSSFIVIPGTYTLTNPRCELINKTTGEELLCKATTEFEVNEKGVVAKVLLHPYTMTASQTAVVNGEKVEISISALSKQGLSWTIETAGCYRVYITDSEDGVYQFSGTLYDANGNNVSSKSKKEDSYTFYLEPGTYYLMDVIAEADTADSKLGYYASVEKLDTVTVSGTLKNESYVALSFTEKNLPTLANNVGDALIPGTVNLDGTFTVQAIAGETCNLEIGTVDGQVHEKEVVVESEDVTDQVIRFYVITILPPQEYTTGYTWEFTRWINFEINKGSMGVGAELYYLTEDMHAESNFYSKATLTNTSTGEVTQYYAVISVYRNGVSKEVSATFNELWVPDSTKDIALNTQTEQVASSTLFKFVPEKDGYYQASVEFTGSDRIYCYLYDQYRQGTRVEELDKNTSQAFYLEAGKTYYIQLATNYYKYSIKALLTEYTPST